MMHNLLESLNQNPFFSGGLSLMVLGASAALLRKLPGQVWALIQRWLSITVEVPDRDPAFRWLQVWLAVQPYAGRARDLSLATTWVPADAESDTAVVFDADDSAATGPSSRVKFLLSPAPGTHLMLYRNRLLILRRSRRDLQNGNARTFQENLSLQVLGGTRVLIEQLLADARKLACPRTPGVSILTARYESWEATSWQPRRPLESLVLADGALEDTLDDLRTFYGSRSWYVQRGIPYRRGYLLHGPPGNGKTTLVLAAAGELNLSVAVLSLSNRLLSDDALRGLVDALPPATLLLIEDVDCVFKAERMTTEQTGVTLSGLLNALDGVSSREGRVLFLTTNHPERLDPALVRPGRVDRKVELGHATPDQARRLFLWFYQDCDVPPRELESLAERFAAQVPRGKTCMAAVQEHLLRHRDAPAAAAHEVVFDEHTSSSSSTPIEAGQKSPAAVGQEKSAAVQAVP
jgi:chaperone BCS1